MSSQGMQVFYDTPNTIIVKMIKVDEKLSSDEA